MKLVILDRDGVINEDSDSFIKSPEEWVPIEGSIAAIARLHQAGFRIVITTNQSGIGRGLFGVDELEAMHKKMIRLINEAGGEVAGVFFCPHHPDDNCQCRKPNVGLIDQLETAMAVSAAGAVVIGDSLRDLQSGIKKGCLPILVKTGKGLKTLSLLAQHPEEMLKQTLVFDDLAQAADYVITNF